MITFVKYCALAGSILMGVIALWGSCWALALQQDGNLVTIKIIKSEKHEPNIDGKVLFLAHSTIRDMHGFEGEHVFTTISALKPGSVFKYYQLSGIKIMDHVEIPGDWYYRWADPMLAFSGAAILLAIFLIMNRRNFRRSSILIIAALALLLSCIMNALLFYDITYLDPFSRTIRIKKYVIDQRINDQFEKDNPDAREQMLEKLTRELKEAEERESRTKSGLKP